MRCWQALLSLAIPMFATSQEPAQTPHDQGPSQQRDNGQATENSFAGRITKGNKGKLMLVDPAKSTPFQLDNQALAKKYEGRARWTKPTTFCTLRRLI